MLNKKLNWLLWGGLVLCCGCIDDTYDLNKEINMDIAIKGNKITLPVGNVKPIVLDSLIDVNDIDVLEKIDDEYCIKKEDEIDPIEIEIDPIKINIDSITHSTTFQFDEVTIEEAVLNEIVKEQTFGVNEVSIDDLNEKLPTLTSAVSTDLSTPEIREQLEDLKKNGASEKISFPMEHSTSTGKQEVKFDLDYELPKEIKDITHITLNNLVRFKVSNPEILNGAKKDISLKASFPTGFVLALDPKADNAGKYTLSPDKRTIEVNHLEANGDAVYVQFYINDITGLSANNGHIILDEQIEYEVDYNVDGNVTLSANTDLTDFTFNVDLQHKVTFEDAKGKTNDIQVDFEQMDFDFSAHFDNLQHIKEVEYIDFDASDSKINFVTDLGDGGFAPFNLKKGSELKLTFPTNFILDESQCHFPKSARYDKDAHAFFITDINELHHFEWQLAIDRVDVYTAVVDSACDLNAIASISVKDNGTLELAATELESLTTTLKSLKSKDVIFTMNETHLHIDDAVVLTETIHEKIEEHTSFSVNEKIDDGVKQIESIEFAELVPIALEVSMNGLEGINTDVHLKLDVTLPSFLILESLDKRVTIDGNKLNIKADYNPKNKDLKIDLIAKKIDFKGEEFPNGMMLKDSTDGNYYLDYESDIPIEGEAYIDETEVHSDILEKDIDINVNFTINEIEVEKFNGIYAGKIDEIHEVVDFDLGEDLDFLKDENNSIGLSDPQIMFTIDNPVGIPVDLALALEGKDDNGQPIENSHVEAKLRLEPATYNYDEEAGTGEVTTHETKFLLTNKPTNLEGYTNVVIEDLSNLLKRIPTTLNIDLIPTIDESVTHHVDLSKELVLHPTYEVVVPLKFDSVHIEYEELVDDLNKDLNEPLEYFSNIEIKASMNIINTVPIGLTLSVEPLDINGNVIEGIVIEDVKIAAGHGGDINAEETNATQGQELVLVVKSQGDVLRKLDKLNLLIQGDADQTVGGVAFSPEQGVHITNIVLEIIGDIETNLEEL